MTSRRFNEDRRRAAEEMAIFDALPLAIREAINDARGSVRASSARDALLRGVPEQAIVDTIRNSKYVTTQPPKGNQS
jgi:hypothetical protein